MSTRIEPKHHHEWQEQEDGQFTVRYKCPCGRWGFSKKRLNGNTPIMEYRSKYRPEIPLKQ